MCFIQGCKTIYGPFPNKPCVFPFIYKDISYSQCTTKDHNVLWCPTEVDAYGKYISGKYGECNSNCGTGTLMYRKVASRSTSMTQLLSHTFAHLTGSSFRLKAKPLPNKKFLGLRYN